MIKSKKEDEAFTSRCHLYPRGKRSLESLLMLLFLSIPPQKILLLSSKYIPNLTAFFISSLLRAILIF